MSLLEVLSELEGWEGGGEGAAVDLGGGGGGAWDVVAASVVTLLTCTGEGMGSGAGLDEG